MESSRVREPRRTALPHGVMGLVSGWSLAYHSNPVFPGGATAKMDASERDSGKWTDM